MSLPHNQPAFSLPRTVHILAWFCIVHASLQLLQPLLVWLPYAGSFGWPGLSFRAGTYFLLTVAVGYLVNLCLLLGGIYARSFRPAGRNLLLTYAYASILLYLMRTPAMAWFYASQSDSRDGAYVITLVASTFLSSTQHLILPLFILFLIGPARDSFQNLPGASAFSVILPAEPAPAEQPR